MCAKSISTLSIFITTKKISPDKPNAFDLVYKFVIQNLANPCALMLLMGIVVYDLNLKIKIVLRTIALFVAYINTFVNTFLCVYKHLTWYCRCSYRLVVVTESPKLKILV